VKEEKELHRVYNEPWEPPCAIACLNICSYFLDFYLTVVLFLSIAHTKPYRNQNRDTNQTVIDLNHYTPIQQH